MFMKLFWVLVPLIFAACTIIDTNGSSTEPATPENLMAIEEAISLVKEYLGNKTYSVASGSTVTELSCSDLAEARLDAVFVGSGYRVWSPYAFSGPRVSVDDQRTPVSSGDAIFYWTVTERTKDITANHPQC